MTGERAPARILVVDDDADNRRALERALRAFGHQVEVARDGIEALAKLRLGVDLVVLDATMPNMDGFEVTERIRSEPEYLDLPIIMVTGLDGHQDRLRAVGAGVNDFLTKPYDLTELKLRSSWLLRLKAAHDEIRRHREDLRRAVDAQTRALREALEDASRAQRETHLAHMDTIRRLVLAAEYKDQVTAAHIERIGRLSALLGKELGLSPRQVEVLGHAAPMHDVGKIGIPDAVLLKRGRLTEDEWAIMRQHPLIGARILHGSWSEVLQVGEIIARSHHEKWDGSGYPAELTGESIPVEGRICAVADVYDALTSDRPYRAALSSDEGFRQIRDDSGKHFDPRLVEAFLDCRSEVEEVVRALREAAGAAGTDDSAKQPGPGRRILIVDDEDGLRSAIGRYLKSRGHEVHAAADGVEALAVLRRAPVDMALIDLDMPRMSGIELIGRCAVEFPDLSYVVVSGREHAIALADHKLPVRPVYLRKPFDLRQLDAIVSQGLAESGGSRAEA